MTVQSSGKNYINNPANQTPLLKWGGFMFDHSCHLVFLDINAEIQLLEVLETFL